MSEKDRFFHEPRRDRAIHERVHDPYKTRSKLPEPTVCPQCGAVYHEGRWTWAARPPEAHEELCQACHRINDQYPAGILALSGDFVRQHQEEILHLARHEEAQEKAEHPLHRIMNIEAGSDGIVINTTDIHLPRRIGEALHRAYRGDLDFHYDEESALFRAHWRR
ncbi:MAG: BCAM0308 family protein [Pseudomonadota bacterium]|uniref:BCAM0308 family protein n=1 Tax=Thermithiobacillus tepidarius TaxID=929 RepID=UPI0003F66EB7|nr:BCAM0308 family protein [Thermithiobacillus tepidarius]